MKSKAKHVEALLISDVHLGSKGSNAKQLLHILKQYEPEILFIVGDFIDGWLLKKRHYWSQDFTNVLQKILSYSKSGTKIVYITGNHDDFLRQFSPTEFGKNIHICDEYIWNNCYITHGDMYDGIVKMKWLAVLGSMGYELAIQIDRFVKRFGIKRSMSKWAKSNVKNAIKFMIDYENQLSYQATKHNCTTVICGHIHNPEIKHVNSVLYVNCGDWIENNSYVTFNDKKFRLHVNNNLK